MRNHIARQYGGSSVILESVKARIEHPEDVIFVEGSIGAKKSLLALQTAAQKPDNVSLKWDGSVSIIFGRDKNGFTLTDKAGFSHPDKGLPRNTQQAYNMILSRKADQEGRKEYALQFASLFPYLEKVVPSNFAGYLQADVMWFAKPPAKGGNFEFQPNKILYQVPVASELGKEINTSKFGIAIHSFFKATGVEVPAPITNITKLKLRKVPGIVVMGSNMPTKQTTTVIDDAVKKMYAYVNNNAKIIDDFLNKETLRSLKLTDMADVLKSFLAAKASGGQHPDKSIGKECYAWIKVNTKLTEDKRARMLNYIQQKKPGYFAIWTTVLGTVTIKNALKKHFDKQTAGVIAGKLAGQNGHEGFVVDGPTKVKLVDRPVFMNSQNTPDRYRKDIQNGKVREARLQQEVGKLKSQLRKSNLREQELERKIRTDKL